MATPVSTVITYDSDDTGMTTALAALVTAGAVNEGKGIADGSAYYGSGIFDGSTYAAGGLIDPADGVAKGGIWDGTAYYDAGILVGGTYYANGISYESGYRYVADGIISEGHVAGLDYAHIYAGGNLTLPAGADVQAGAAPYGIGAYGGDGSLVETPSYPITADSKAAQLADDQAEVAAKTAFIVAGTDFGTNLGASGGLLAVADILTTGTGVGAGGTYVEPVQSQVQDATNGGTAYGPSGATAGTLAEPATQLATDQAAVQAQAANISIAVTDLLGTVDGTLASMILDAAGAQNAWQGAGIYTDPATYNATGMFDGFTVTPTTDWTLTANIVFPDVENVVYNSGDYGIWNPPNNNWATQYIGLLDMSLYALISGIVIPAVENVTTAETAYGLTGELAGTLDMSLYAPWQGAGIYADTGTYYANGIWDGTAYYPNGIFDGSTHYATGIYEEYYSLYHASGVLNQNGYYTAWIGAGIYLDEVAGHASGVLDASGNYSATGHYDGSDITSISDWTLTAGIVIPAVANVSIVETGYGLTGELAGTLDVAALEAAAAAAQLVTDQAAVLAVADSIKSTVTDLLGQAGTLDMSLWTLLSALTFPAAGNVSVAETSYGPEGTGYAGTLASMILDDNGTQHAFTAGIWDAGYDWNAKGIFDGTTYQPYGIFDGSTYAAGGLIDPADGVAKGGIWDGNTYYANGIWDGTAYHPYGIFDGTTYYNVRLGGSGEMAFVFV